MAEKFTPKQQNFIVEYVKDFNATAAADRAGYQGSRNTLSAMGAENLRKPKISKRIKDILIKKAMSAEEVLFRLTRQARGNIDDFLVERESGEIGIDLAKGRAAGCMDLIHSIKFTEDEITDGFRVRKIEIKLHDQQAALALLGKAHRLFVERINLEDAAIVNRFTADEYAQAAAEIEEWLDE